MAHRGQGTHIQNTLIQCSNRETTTKVWQTIFKADILACQSRKSPGGIYNINEGCILFRWASSRVLVLCMLNHWHGLLWHIRMEPLLILLVTPVLFLVGQIKMCAMKGVYMVVGYVKVKKQYALHSSHLSTSLSRGMFSSKCHSSCIIKHQDQYIWVIRKMCHCYNSDVVGNIIYKLETGI